MASLIRWYVPTHDILKCPCDASGGLVFSQDVPVSDLDGFCLSLINIQLMPKVTGPSDSFVAGLGTSGIGIGLGNN